MARWACAPIHPKAMRVILPPEEVDLWFAADMPKAFELQRPLPDDALGVVASERTESRPKRPARMMTASITMKALAWWSRGKD
jgi:putative SOS response-associated peptidase YedK